MVVKTVVEAQDIFDKAWEGFKGVDWKEKASVSRFVQANYTPYDGDESFLGTHGRMDTKSSSLIATGRNDSPPTCLSRVASNNDRFSSEFRIILDFHRSKKGIHVNMDDFS